MVFLPFGDSAAAVGAALLTIGAIGVGTYITFNPPKVIEKEEQKQEQIYAQPPSKNQAIFPKNPHQFRPLGLIKRELKGTYNGQIIMWCNPITNAPIFEWDEDLKNGSHYHIMLPVWEGKHCDGIHYKAGDVVPEPWNTIYFGG